MAISHDLSSEIAAALLVSADKTPSEREALKDLLLLVHSTLQELTVEARPDFKQRALAQNVLREDD